MNIILFDGICNLCNSTVDFLIKYDKNDKLYFTAQQSLFGGKLMKELKIEHDNRSVILIKDNQVYYKSDAILEIVKLMPGWPRIALFIIIFPKFFRDGLYDLIANNRYRLFGKQNICSVPTQKNKHKFMS